MRGWGRNTRVRKKYEDFFPLILVRLEKKLKKCKIAGIVRKTGVISGGFISVGERTCMSEFIRVSSRRDMGGGNPPRNIDCVRATESPSVWNMCLGEQCWFHKRNQCFWNR